MRIFIHSDANARPIADWFREQGATFEFVQAPMGRKGVYDGILGYNHVTAHIEFKKPEMKGKKTAQKKAQDEWAAKWKGGPCFEVCDLEDAANVLNVLEGMRMLNP